MIPENCKKIVINNPFYEEDITQEEAEYIITKQDLDELRRCRLDKAIRNISSVVSRKFNDYVAEKSKELTDILQTETLKEKSELISELKSLEKQKEQLEDELSVVNHKISDAIEVLVRYFNAKCHENNAHGISGFNIKSYKDFLKKLACKTTLKHFTMYHKIESDIWFNEKHDLKYLEENRDALVEKYLKLLMEENEKYDIYNKIVRDITH